MKNQLLVILAIINIVLGIANTIVALTQYERNWHSAAGWFVSCLGWTVVVLDNL